MGSYHIGSCLPCQVASLPPSLVWCEFPLLGRGSLTRASESPRSGTRLPVSRRPTSRGFRPDIGCLRHARQADEASATSRLPRVPHNLPRTDLAEEPAANRARRASRVHEIAREHPETRLIVFAETALGWFWYVKERGLTHEESVRRPKSYHERIAEADPAPLSAGGLSASNGLGTIRFMMNAPPNGLHANLADLLRALDRVVARLASIQQTPRTYGAGAPLYGTEIHTVQAIGENVGANLTRLAKQMGVTKGAVSQTIAKLVDKGLAVKRPAPENAREIRIELTDAGRIAYRSHEAFDRKILTSIKAHCGSETPAKVRLYLEVLRDFEAILHSFEAASGQPHESGEGSAP
jgi:DNA-binding MarR family transcriptional regulator